MTSNGVKLWMKHMLPKSKKARNLLVLFVFSALILTAFFFIKKPPSRTQIIDNTTQNNTNISISTKDSDEDGLKDWEEIIFRTNPYSPDTDGDKTPDGEEVKLGRDPLKSGPDDIIMPEETKEARQESETDTEDNLTKTLAKKFGEEFIAPYLSNPEGFKSSKFLGQNLVNDLLTNQASLPKETLSEKDIILSPNNTSLAIKSYGKNFDEIILEAFKNTSGKQELLIFAAAIKEDNFAILSELDPFILGYNILIKKFKILGVPSELKNLHLEYLNAALSQKNAVEKMRKAKEDIILALVGMNEYFNASEELNKTAQKIQREFRARNISFQ